MEFNIYNETNSLTLLISNLPELLKIINKKGYAKYAKTNKDDNMENANNILMSWWNWAKIRVIYNFLSIDFFWIFVIIIMKILKN